MLNIHYLGVADGLKVTSLITDRMFIARDQYLREPVPHSFSNKVENGLVFALFPGSVVQLFLNPTALPLNCSK
jgi:hypothetical protein